ncbi:MAG TPA: hypothetical protein VLU43_16300 [Anaeromyxobacteraceae bacterium]|nr:hypothetical protein [Anaeromyxobacteraceae bacterium]
MTTTYHLFDVAERIEVVSAEIYGALAIVWAGDADAKALFGQLQDEELQHAARVRLLAARYRHDPRIVRLATADGGELERLLVDAEAMLGDIRAGRWPHALAETKRRLAEMELRTERAHAEFLSKGADAALREFFEQLAQQDDAHRALLAE